MAETQIWTPEPAEKYPEHSWTVLLQSGEEESITAHTLSHEHGALVLYEYHNNSRVMVNIYAPGTWQYASLDDGVME